MNITYGLRLASERVIEMLPSASAKNALLGVGILTDKMQLLSGDVTARIEVAEKPVDIWAHWENYVRGEVPGLVDAKYLPVKEGELSNSANKVLETGLSGEKNLLLGKALEDAVGNDASDSRPEVNAGAVPCPQRLLTDQGATLGPGPDGDEP